MAQQTRTAFTFQIGAYDAESLAVSRFAGAEGLSRLYEFQVDFHPTGVDPLDAETLLGTEAVLTLRTLGGPPRQVHGMACRVEVLGRREGHWCYRAWVVPRLWRLTRIQRSRIFQGKTVPDILQAVLAEAQLDARLLLTGKYEAREYCTQYRETDFAFLSRLMEWEGLFYFFEHTARGHVLVVGDSPDVHAHLPQVSALPVRDQEGRVEDGESLHALERILRLRPGTVHLKDYDFERPALDVSGKAKGPEERGALEVYDYPAAYVTPAVGKAVAKVRLEEAVQATRTLEGEGVAPSLTPGFRFQVEDAGHHAGEYTAVEVIHSGWLPETPGTPETTGGLYTCRFKCMPQSVPFRPRRTTDVPTLAGLQTATVVGPAGQEIHTDGHGRIKVQFHWDRDGQRDDRASCWVRVGQAWGGLAWGAVYLPRVGQEVLVRFLEGNPDRPLVAGTVYNGANPTPYTLPDEKTTSTLKSASSPGGAGFNELRIEDAAGQEEIFTHAQKDEALLTENDKDQEVRGHEALRVKKDRQQLVEGNQRLAVSLDDASLIEGNQGLRVRGHRTTSTLGSHDETVDVLQSIRVQRNVTTTVALTSAETVGSAKALTVGAGYAINVGLALSEDVAEDKHVRVGAVRLERVGGSRQETIAEDSDAQVKLNFQSRVKGDLSRVIGKDLEEKVSKKSELSVKQEAACLAKTFAFKAETFSLVVDGKPILRIEKSGKVKFTPKTLTIDGSTVQFKGAKIKLLK
ncbi:type VI secretion system Vgr family protein [Archangium primigenium]|uniref:type VI secretion system Vgr family protein n=1 Tax=[Archangium] primigenium TaxID=2792470 RepID=UPI00195BE16F|nr:type VI secretion system tip protein TssI/VgrG [Archangium primigenium]MBM7116343.1 type VI secretion system tip protein VgrG [Archangium primigenium]